MKIILTTLNSKFVHSNLAIRYLSKYVEDVTTVDICEFTINQHIDFIVSEIYKEKPDLVGFSTYIWNIEETLKICETLKMIMPDVKILLGGPEVSYDPVRILEENLFIDYIIYGEGEETFKEFIKGFIDEDRDFKEILGLSYREGNQVVKTGMRPLIKNLDKIPSPYLKINNEFENRIIYYESSRGCPFGCKFCLSSTIDGVRYFNIDRVKSDLDKLIEGKVRQVKFVDRTFNANKKYAMEIMNFIIDKNPSDINFHFEVTAHLLDEEMLDFLKDIRDGLFQFEIGVQSTNEKTIKSIGRTTDFEKLTEVTKRIKSYENIHQHLDLIAGLPYEGYESFKKSFNQVYDIRPEKLQLGFLKLLKGSDLRLDQKKYGYKYLNSPPYEVLENDFINYGEIIKLKAIEDLVEKYYNDGYFEHSLNFIIKNYFADSFSFYESFSEFWEMKDYYRVSHSKNGLYEILMEFFNYKEYKDQIIFSNLIKLDYIINNRKTSLPRGLIREQNYNIQKNIHDILKDERILKEYLSEYRELPTKILINRVIVEEFDVNVFEIINKGYNPIEESSKTYILFDYIGGRIIRCKYYDITEIVKELI